MALIEQAQPAGFSVASWR